MRFYSHFTSLAATLTPLKLKRLRTAAVVDNNSLYVYSVNFVFLCHQYGSILRPVGEEKGRPYRSRGGESERFVGAGRLFPPQPTGRARQVEERH